MTKRECCEHEYIGDNHSPLVTEGDTTYCRACGTVHPYDEKYKYLFPDEDPDAGRVDRYENI